VVLFTVGVVFVVDAYVNVDGESETRVLAIRDEREREVKEDAMMR
jgi:hypothetical protein